ncbi:RHS repeat protein, partial [bacterium]|nr:RHS repeat protein [bacterium]
MLSIVWNSSRVRVVSVLVLIFCSHVFLGLDQLATSLSWGQGSGGEVCRELDYDLAMVDLAESLDFRALDLYEWVRREISYEPYRGSRKGARGVFHSRSGNDVDQALLLASLMGLADKEWRLAKGTVRFAAGDAVSWLGVSTIAQAESVLSKGGVAFSPSGSGPDPEHLILKDHVWLEVEEDYFPLRGSARDDLSTPTEALVVGRDQADRWVSLDPSVTFLETPASVSLDEVFGVYSADLFERILEGTTNPEPGVASAIPYRLIRSSVRQAGEAFHRYLQGEGETIETCLGMPERPVLAAREALPGNLPYVVMGDPDLYDGPRGEDNDSIQLIGEERVEVRITLRNSSGGEAGRRVRLSSLNDPLGAVLYFGAEGEGWLDTDGSLPVVSLSSSRRVSAYLRVWAEETGASDDPDKSALFECDLGETLYLTVEEIDSGFEDRTVREIPIIAGGLYSFCGFSALDEWEAGRRRAELVQLSQKGGDQVQALRSWLGLAGLSISRQRRSFTRLGAAALGYANFDEPPLVVGIEPTLSGDSLTTPQLVAHPIRAMAGCSARVTTDCDPFEADQAVGLLSDVALTACAKDLTGRDGYQSTSRLLATGVFLGQSFTTLEAGTVDLPEGAVPAGLSDIVSDPLADALFFGPATLASTDLFTSACVGADLAPAGWGWWGIRDDGPGWGQAWETTHTIRTAWTVLEDLDENGTDLCPLDTIPNGDTSPARLQALLLRGIEWSRNAVSVTESTEPGVVAATRVIRHWMGDAQSAPDPSAYPSATYALHEAVSYFSAPRIVVMEAGPGFLNSNEEDLRVAVRVSRKVDGVDLLFTDEDGDENPESQTIPEHEDLISSATVDLAGVPDGAYMLTAQAFQGTATSGLRACSYVVDNTDPLVELIAPSTVSGSFIIQCRVQDAHLSSYTLTWTNGGRHGILCSGDTNVPILSRFLSANSRDLGWNGGVVLCLAASDKAGNSETASAQITARNDIEPPVVDLVGISWENPLSGTHHFGVTASDTPDGANGGQGLTRVRVWVERENPSDEEPLMLFDRDFPPGSTWGFGWPVSLNTYALDRSKNPDVPWRVVAEATDGSGLTSRTVVGNITVNNGLKAFVVNPTTFRPGTTAEEQASSDYQVDFHGIFADPNAYDWTLELYQRQANGSYGLQAKPIGSGSGQIGLNPYSWCGTPSGEADGSTPYPAGAYRVKLTYTPVDPESGIEGGSTSRTLIIAADKKDLECHLTRLESLNATGDLGTSLPLTAGTGQTGESFFLTGEHYQLRIQGQINAGLRLILDGEGPTPHFAAYPYDDAFWAVEIKSSTMFPTYADIERAGSNRGLAWNGLVHRSNWRMIEWGNGWPEGGLVDATYDTRALAEGYYDVRLWVTDGMNLSHALACYLKVTRASDSPNPGGPDGVGQMTLTASDLAVPFNGFTAEISRTYRSQDTLAPGPMGYGWQLNAVSLGIERLETSEPEYDEAMIRLPDGREFFFANNPPLQDSTAMASLQSSLWAARGGYLNRPFGMELYRPGASKAYHWPRAEVLSVIGPNPSLTPLPTLPGEEPRQTDVVYTQVPRPGGGQWQPGEVAYLKIEDRTWHIFEWSTGRLLEILQPDGRSVTFTPQDNATTLISDGAREVTLRTEEYATAPDGPSTHRAARVKEVVDPAGQTIRYDYDQYGNLITVADRSGRKRFYIYDTPETLQLFPEKENVTGLNPHYLVDVRVDDDSDNVCNFDREITTWSVERPNETVTARFTDTLPSDSAAAEQGLLADYQNYPGDVSIMEITYEGGLLKAIETAGGSVEIDHDYDADDASGTETVRDGLTGARNRVAYDNQRRVTHQEDPYGAVTHYAYNDDDAEAKIKGVLEAETNALGEVTSYAYDLNFEPQHNSFSDMFAAYFGSKFNAELTNPTDLNDRGPDGYLTSAQASPTAITQHLGLQAITTNIDYKSHSDPNAPFQPSVVTDPLGNKTELQYAPGGAIETVSFEGQSGAKGARVVNFYYGTPGGEEGLDPNEQDEEWRNETFADDAYITVTG